MERENLILLPESFYGHPTARTGLLFSKSWWLATDDNRIAVYTMDRGSTVSFQCNEDENVIQAVLREMKSPIEFHARQIDMVVCPERTSSRWKALWKKYNAATLANNDIKIMRDWLCAIAVPPKEEAEKISRMYKRLPKNQKPVFFARDFQPIKISEPGQLARLMNADFDDEQILSMVATAKKNGSWKNICESQKTKSARP